MLLDLYCLAAFYVYNPFCICANEKFIVILPQNSNND